MSMDERRPKTLHPAAEEMRVAATQLPPSYEIPLEAARVRMRSALIRQAEPSSLRVADFIVPAGDRGIRVRAYRPPGHRNPALVFFHGGGWVFNDLDTHDELCRTIAEVAQCSVFSVDYRRSPEHTYPAAIDDGDVVFEWLLTNSDEFDVEPGAFALGGDSAGGTIATALAKRIRERGARQLAAHFLLYPVLDYWDPGTPSYGERGPGFTVDRSFMKWIWDAYLPAQWVREDPHLFPLQGSLADLPPTVLCVAEYDVLRDEGIEYARLLRQAEVPVTLLVADDQMHGFAHHLALIETAKDMVLTAATRLGRALRGG
ncbi:hypothetical protein OPAG_05046 [Rhodococcus opacus PD630]|nr:hypothetical protein OPAG_05046 [Rhodococcus opacus PD630]UDG94230.1 alpha/beta hydrolase [Rhodococcus opacus PD630]